MLKINKIFFYSNMIKPGVFLEIKRLGERLKNYQNGSSPAISGNLEGLHA